MAKHSRGEHRRGRTHTRRGRAAPFLSADDPIYQDRDGAISRWKDWLDHRYDPGYWLGGRLPPLMTALQGETPAAAMYGALLIASALGSWLWAARTIWEGEMANAAGLVTVSITILFGLLVFSAGVVAIRRARKRRRAERDSDRGAARRHQ